MMKWLQKEASEAKSPVMWRDVMVEALCSYTLIFFLTSNQLVYSETFVVTPTHAGLVMGFTVFMLVESFGHMSGAHMNPAVTLLFLCKRKVTLVRSVFYMIAQVAGGAGGAATIYAFASESKRALFVPFAPAAELSLLQAVGMEVALTFFLCSAVQGPGDTQERTTPCPLPGLPAGLIVAADIMVAGTWTGAAMNPLIALGPDICSGDFTHYWIYWLGPFIGAVLSCLLYEGLSYVQRRHGQTPAARRKAERMEEVAELLTSLLNKDDNANGATKGLMEKLELDQTHA